MPTNINGSDLQVRLFVDQISPPEVTIAIFHPKAKCARLSLEVKANGNVSEYFRVIPIDDIVPKEPDFRGFEHSRLAVDLALHLIRFSKI
jgi:hypothetical protein